MKSNPDLAQRRSVRLQHYDYAQPGIYFVTICTRNRTTSFSDDRLRDLASSAWRAIPDHASRVSLDEWVVMPNHVHGLLVLSGEAPETIEPEHSKALPTGCVGQRMAAMSARGASLPVILRTYKPAVTTACRGAGYANFGWLAGY